VIGTLKVCPGNNDAADAAASLQHITLGLVLIQESLLLFFLFCFGGNFEYNDQTVVLR